MQMSSPVSYYMVTHEKTIIAFHLSGEISKLYPSVRCKVRSPGVLYVKVPRDDDFEDKVKDLTGVEQITEISADIYNLDSLKDPSEEIQMKLKNYKRFSTKVNIDECTKFMRELEVLCGYLSLDLILRILEQQGPEAVWKINFAKKHYDTFKNLSKPRANTVVSNLSLQPDQRNQRPRVTPKLVDKYPNSLTFHSLVRDMANANVRDRHPDAARGGDRGARGARGTRGARGQTRDQTMAQPHAQSSQHIDLGLDSEIREQRSVDDWDFFQRRAARHQIQSMDIQAEPLTTNPFQILDLKYIDMRRILVDDTATIDTKVFQDREYLKYTKEKFVDFIVSSIMASSRKEKELRGRLDFEYITDEYLMNQPNFFGAGVGLRFAEFPPERGHTYERVLPSQYRVMPTFPVGYKTVNARIASRLREDYATFLNRKNYVSRDDDVAVF